MQSDNRIILKQMIYDILKAGYQHYENKPPVIPEILGGKQDDANGNFNSTNGNGTPIQ